MNNIIKLQSSARDNAIDAARGVALFLVVFSHARHNSYYITAFYITAFFFLSGWLYKPGKTYKENIKKKALRVLLPYFLNSIVLLAVYAAINSFSIDYIKTAIGGIIYSRNIVCVGDSPIMVSGNAPLWYLTAYFSTSLLFHNLVDRVTDSWGHLALTSLMLITISIIMAQLPFLMPWSLDMVPFFTVIMLLSYNAKKNGLNLNMKWLTTLLVIIGYIGLTYDNGSVNLSIRNYGGGQISALCLGISGTLGCISLCYKKELKYICNFFVEIGTNSIVVLSYHLLFFFIFRSIYRRYILPYCGNSIEDTFIYDLIIVLMSVLSCVAIGKVYEVVKSKMVLSN